MTGRRRLLLMVNRLEVGGAERQLVELASALDTERFEVIVVTLEPGGPLEADLDRAGVESISLNRRSKADPGTLPKLIALLRRRGIDIIQPFLTPSTFYGLSAALIARTPVKVATERNGVRLHPGFGASTYRFIEDRLTRFADVVVANSGAGVDYLACRGIQGGKVRLIYNGVNPRRVTASTADIEAVRQALGIPNTAPVIGIVASLEAAKDHATFLQAAARVMAQRPAVHAVIVGDGTLRDELESQARQLGIAGAVRFTGNRGEVASLIGMFDVAVLSSRDHEGCSNFLLEAMGMGRPLVATTIGGNPELVREGVNGYLAAPGDADAMAGRILQLLGDDELRIGMGRASRQLFDAGFSLRRMVDSYEALYEELWDRRASTRRLAVSAASR